MRVSEPDLVLPALYVIADKPGISTAELIGELTRIFRPAGEDAEILQGRSDTKFSQMVRNLVSHNTLEGEGYVRSFEGEQRRSGRRFELIEAGERVLEENLPELEYLLENGFPYEDTISGLQTISGGQPERRQAHLIDENLVIQEGRKRTVSTTAYERSSAVRQAAIEHYRNEDGQIDCSVCGFNFYDRYGERGRDFIEIHHEKPLFETEGVERAQFLESAVQAVKPVCSNCHRMIHRKRDHTISVEELQGIIEGR